MEVLPRRERERQEHVRHILDVARQMFAKRGFFKVKMKEIAEQAEFALGTLYGFFKGKQSLYQQVIGQKVDELVASVSDAMAEEISPVLVVKRFIEAKLQFFFENLDFVRLYFAEMHGPPLYGERTLSVTLQGKYGALLERVSGALERGISDGTFAEASPKALAIAIDGQTSAVVLSWLREISPGSPGNEIEAAEQIFLNGALARSSGSDARDRDHVSKEI